MAIRGLPRGRHELLLMRLSRHGFHVVITQRILEGTQRAESFLQSHFGRTKENTGKF